MYKFVLFVVLLKISIISNAQTKDNKLLSLVQSFAKTSAVTGREGEAAQFVMSLFKTGTFKTDKLGNLILTIGSGYPKKLFATPLDEPGYVVSNIMRTGISV